MLFGIFMALLDIRLETVHLICIFCSCWKTIRMRVFFFLFCFVFALLY